MNKTLTSHKSDYWKRKNFVNPPYSQIEKWVSKAIIEAAWFENKVTMLLPARTDTKWFKALWDFGAFFEFITGRLHFNDTKNSAPFPSMYVTLSRYDNQKSKVALIENPEKL